MSIASFFKRAESSGSKRPREEDDDAAPAAPKPHVRTLAAWNANSLIQRIQCNRPDLDRFLREHSPDVVFISEVRSPALGPAGCKKGDGQRRQQDKLSRASHSLASEADAIARFVRQHGYRAYWSLAEYKYAGTGLLVKAACEQPRELRHSLDPNAAAATHQTEGRVILASFERFDLLGTYTPNNGGSEDAHARRRRWDEACAALLQRRGGAAAARPLVWLGDLNVAAEWGDVGPDPGWFRDKNGQGAAHADDRGQPGFTPNEQARFRSLLAAGGLVDAYRTLHPVANWATDVTWRGCAGKDGPPAAGRYYAKGMRIDYVLVDRRLAGSVVRAEVLGGGAERRGFLGSDHCPLLVELAAAEEAKEGDGSRAAEAGHARAASATGSAPHDARPLADGVGLGAGARWPVGSSSS